MVSETSIAGMEEPSIRAVLKVLYFGMELIYAVYVTVPDTTPITNGVRYLTVFSSDGTNAASLSKKANP